jgi:hypothetical protein
VALLCGSWVGQLSDIGSPDSGGAALAHPFLASDWG